MRSATTAICVIVGCLTVALTACDTSGGEAPRALDACKKAAAHRASSTQPTFSDLDSTTNGTRWTVTGRVHNGSSSKLFTCTVDAPAFTNAKALLEGDNVPGSP